MRIIIFPTEERSQSNGQHLRYVDVSAYDHLLGSLSILKLLWSILTLKFVLSIN
jgi:hypothetical protein